MTQPKFPTGWGLCSTRESETRPLNPASAGFGAYSAGGRPPHVDPCGGQVHSLGILVQHPEGREPPDRAGDRTLHLGGPAGRKVVLVAVVEGRPVSLLGEPLQILRVVVVRGPLVGVGPATADGPAVVADPALVP